MKPKAEKTLVSRELLRKLLVAGGGCSNVLFNKSHHTTISVDDRRHMKEYQIDWDKAARALREDVRL